MARLVLFANVLLVFILSSCNSIDSSFRGGVKSNWGEGATAQEAVDGAQDTSTMQSIGRNLSFEDMQSVLMSDYFVEASQRATDDVIDFEGYQFSNIKSFMEEHKSDYLDLADTYVTLGQYFESINIFAESDILPEFVTQGAAILKKIYGDGLSKEMLNKYAKNQASAEMNVPSVELNVSNSSSKIEPNFRHHVLIALGSLPYASKVFSLVESDWDRANKESERMRENYEASQEAMQAIFGGAKLDTTKCNDVYCGADAPQEKRREHGWL